jgi:hypothetical protein
MGHKTVNGVDLPWCNHLKMGSLTNNMTDAEHAALEEAWGVETHPADEDARKVLQLPEGQTTYTTLATPKEFDLFLLWDQCKECGKNDFEYYEGKTKTPTWFIEFEAHAELPHAKRSPRAFTLSVSIRRGEKKTELRELVRFLRKLPNTLRKNLGIKDATVDLGLAQPVSLTAWDSVNLVHAAALKLQHAHKAHRHGKNKKHHA